MGNAPGGFKGFLVSQRGKKFSKIREIGQFVR
jgi:hypothetical protein